MLQYINLNFVQLTPSSSFYDNALNRRSSSSPDSQSLLSVISLNREKWPPVRRFAMVWCRPYGISNHSSRRRAPRRIFEANFRQCLLGQYFKLLEHVPVPFFAIIDKAAKLYYCLMMADKTQRALRHRAQHQQAYLLSPICSLHSTKSITREINNDISTDNGE